MMDDARVSVRVVSFSTHVVVDPAWGVHVGERPVGLAVDRRPMDRIRSCRTRIVVLFVCRVLSTARFSFCILVSDNYYTTGRGFRLWRMHTHLVAAPHLRATDY